MEGLRLPYFPLECERTESIDPLIATLARDTFIWGYSTHMPLIGRFIDEIKILTGPLARYRVSPVKEVALKWLQNHFFMLMGECNR